MRLAILLMAGLLALPTAALAEAIRLKDLGRFAGWRENVLVGYGVVTGLAGSGDSPRNPVTQQAMSSVLSRFGANVSADQMRSRNVAAVMVMGVLPPAANIGDRIDVTVTSIGDARSLTGGALLLTPLLGPDQRPYALAQGALVVGGYRYDANANAAQKNHPTAAIVPGGALIEAMAEEDVLSSAKDLVFILKDPDFTTAERIADGINQSTGRVIARVRDANAVKIDAAGAGMAPYRLIARIESVTVDPDAQARVVVNERSGTVVAGGGARISSVVVSQGDIKVSVVVENDAAQPALYGGYAPGVRSLIVSNTRLTVEEPSRDAVVRVPDTTVADLVEALSRAKVGTRDLIGVLQAIKTAGALHADLIVQ